jgi:hypothetical protein
MLWSIKRSPLFSYAGDKILGGVYYRLVFPFSWLHINPQFQHELNMQAKTLEHTLSIELRFAGQLWTHSQLPPQQLLALTRYQRSKMYQTGPVGTMRKLFSHRPRYSLIAL